MLTAVDCGSNSKLDPFRHVQPMKFMMQGICQTSLEFVCEKLVYFPSSKWLAVCVELHCPMFLKWVYIL